MKKKIFVIFFLFIGFNLNAQIIQENKILAKVGAQIITSVDLINEMKIIAILNKLDSNQINEKQLKQNAMQNLIRLSIKKNEIEKFKANAYSNKEYEDNLKKILSSLNLNFSQFNQVLENNFITYEYFKKRFEVNLIWNGLIYSIYKNQININPLELEAELQNIMSRKSTIREYNLSEIEFELDGKDLKKRNIELLEVIKKQGFAKAVSIFSISESNLNEGKIGWINENSLSNLILQELKNLRKGELTKPIIKGETFLILRINDIKETSNVSNNDIEYINNLKNKIMSRKKEEKLNLFSRSHFTRAENSILIELNE